jgi:hypothetical protein
MKDFYNKFLRYNIPFHIFSIIAMGLLITAFFIPPQGEIHPSVLYGISECFAFASLWTVLVAIEKGGVAKIKHKETELEIKNEKKPEEPVIKTRRKE